MLELKLANVEDAEAQYFALSKIPADENGFKNDYSKVSLEDFKNHHIKKIIANSEGKDLPAGYVPFSIYFLWDDDQIVGIFHFRHYLCASLRKEGGHVGYVILPEFRGRHYATRGLKMLIDEVKDLIAEDELWLDAYCDNLASQKVMLNNGAYVTSNDGKTVHMRIKLPKNNLVSKIKQLIQEKSAQYQANDPGQYDFWNGHLRYVYQEATELAMKYQADVEIVQLGALLHDIALLEKVGTKADHHENGELIAKEILQTYNYPEDKMERVLGCVLHHRSSKNTQNIEELCVADADILAHFDNIPMFFDAAYNLHKIVGIGNVRKFIQDSFRKDFDDLSERTKQDFQDRYQMICEVVLGTE